MAVFDRRPIDRKSSARYKHYRGSCANQSTEQMLQLSEAVDVDFQVLDFFSVAPRLRQNQKLGIHHPPLGPFHVSASASQPPGRGTT